MHVFVCTEVILFKLICGNVGRVTPAVGQTSFFFFLNDTFPSKEANSSSNDRKTFHSADFLLPAHVNFNY